jgi:glutamate-1-semialdehyde aminotransferase
MNSRTFVKNKAALERGLKVTPLSSQTYSKSYRYISGNSAPYFIDRGKGAYVWDIDGNKYVDFILGLGPITIGYNDPEVNEAVIKQLSKGICFSQSNILEVEFAEKLAEIIPCAEMTRIVKNGGDATTAAVRLARAATGRKIIATCGYHGMHDWSIGTTVLNDGIPREVSDLSKAFTYNDIASLNAIFDENDGQVAAVIMEPVQDSGEKDGFLQKVRDLCTAKGTVLVFDEIVSGFRIALGGGQEYYGVTPDLAAVGKGMANGMPISAITGKKEILKLVEDGIFVSTTFGGDTVSIAAALKTIEILQRPGSFEHIWEISTRLKDVSERMTRDAGLEDTMSMWGLAPHSGFMFKKTGDLNEIDLLSIYQQRFIDEGILTLGVNNFCLAHTIEDINRHLEVVGDALNDVANAIAQNSSENFLTGNKIRPVFKRN